MPKLIKTIKIASIVTACLAILLLALPALSGDNGKKKENPQKPESIIEKFKRLRGPKTGSENDQIPPLIKEARAFALYLNPPPPPKPPESRTETPRIPGIPNVPAAPTMSSARFNLIATCVNQANPESSLALIEEPGQDRRWIRQAATIGHLTIKEILDGKIIIQDSSRTYQLEMAKTPQEISLLTSSLDQKGNAPDNKSSSINIETPTTISSPENRNASYTATPNRPGTTPQAEATEPPALTPEQEKVLQKFMDEMDSLITSAGDDEETLEKSFQKSDEILDKYLKQLENTHIDQQETEDLNDLGKLLEGITDPNNLGPPDTNTE